MRRLVFAIKSDDECQTDCHLGRRDRNDKEHHDLTIQMIVESRACDQREIGGIKHQFQRHVNNQQIATKDHPQQANTEKQRAEEEIVFQTNRHKLLSFQISFTEQHYPDHGHKQQNRYDFKRQQIRAEKQFSKGNRAAFYRRRGRGQSLA